MLVYTDDCWLLVNLLSPPLKPFSSSSPCCFLLLFIQYNFTNFFYPSADSKLEEEREKETLIPQFIHLQTLYWVGAFSCPHDAQSSDESWVFLIISPQGFEIQVKGT